MLSQKKYMRVAEWSDAGEDWVPTSDVVVGGHDVNGEKIYVGRAFHDDEVIPGKVVASHGVCYVAHGGEEHGIEKFQVLKNTNDLEFTWLPSSNGDVPTGALQGGATADGEALYIGRHEHEGSFTIGKIHPSHGVVYLPFAGKEHGYKNYEVLCVKNVLLR